jgi:hypothetical protein
MTHVVSAESCRPGAVAGRGGARSALGFVRRGLVAPVNQLAGFTAVPNLGVVLGVQAPAAQLARLRASATHARLVRVESAYQGSSFRYGCSVAYASSVTPLLDHRKCSQVFHSEGHVPVKRADGHILPDESHQVDLSDDALRDGVPQLSRFCPPLHRHRQVYFKSVRTATIAAPNGIVRSSYGIKEEIFLCNTLLVVMLGTFAPELERETGIRVHAIACIVAVARREQSTAVALSYGRLVPFDRFLYVRSVVPLPTLVALRGVKRCKAEHRRHHFLLRLSDTRLTPSSRRARPLRPDCKICQVHIGSRCHRPLLPCNTT